MSIFNNRNIHCIGCEKLAEGKTKIIWQHPVAGNIVYIAQKSQITAGDGKKKDSLKDKDIYANITTCNVFRLLNRKRIPTHFLGQVSQNEFIALKCRMIPLEVVVRRIAYGSYLKRNPDVKEGTIFDKLVVEFFLKDDRRHDPIILLNLSGEYFLADSQRPVSSETIFEEGKKNEEGKLEQFGLYIGQLWEIKELAENVFEILEETLAKQRTTLVDNKIEFGFTPDNLLIDKLVVADVIDNDSWRIWVDGDPNKALDKQNYRDGIKDLDSITSDYAFVAELTNKFFEK